MTTQFTQTPSSLYHKAIFSFFLLTCCLLISCKQPLNSKENTLYDPTKTPHLTLTNDLEAVFLSEADARQAIILDSMTAFFRGITPTDIALQINDSDLLDADSTTLQQQYKSYLQANVRPFSQREQLLVYHTFQKIITALDGKNMGLPRAIYCLKTTGEGYGEQTYYTRNGCIILPEPALNAALNGDTTHFEYVLSHELFHLISRYNPALKLKLYRQIGFDTIHNLLIENELLRNRLIENPDGMQHATIKLNDTTHGILLCYSRSPDFKLGANNFHAHFKWGMFQLKKTRLNTWRVVADSLGESTLSNTWEVPFFRKVGTNTDYLIHPDEILADNFALLLRYRKNKPLTTDLDASGIVLLQHLERIIFAPEPPKKTSKTH